MNIGFKNVMFQKMSAIKWFPKWLITLIFIMVLFPLALMSVLIGTLFIISAPSLDNARKYFLRDQLQVDALVHVFERRSKLDFIGRSTFDAVFGRGGSVSVRSWEEGLAEWGVVPTGQLAKRILTDHLMSVDDLESIIDAMRAANVSSINFNNNGSEEKKYIEVGYPDVSSGFRCGWFFVTPIAPHTIQEIAKESLATDKAGGEEGPYILNERWLMYKRCVA